MKQKRILIADDDQALVRVLALRCRNLGLEVQSAPDAMFALSLIHKQPPDVILLDINMPAGDGLAVCEMLANDQRLSKIPVLIMTGQSDQETIDRCRSLHARYIKKSTDLWAQIKPVLCELCDIDPTTSRVL